MIKYSLYLEEKQVTNLFKPYLKKFMKNINGAKKLVSSLAYYDSCLP
jgi:hypothetical protein